ncbi:hypothetical protein GE061_006813, partial [Apolygus lucorum]
MIICHSNKLDLAISLSVPEGGFYVSFLLFFVNSATNFHFRFLPFVSTFSIEMSDPVDKLGSDVADLEIESNYKPPPEKSLEEILSADQEDESLQKYKAALLGEAQAQAIIVDPSDERKVIVKKLALCVDGRPDMELDLTTNLEALKKQTFTIKEGISYKIRIDFIVQREIVHGLRYVQKTYRLGVP